MLVFANKQDVPGCMSVEEVTEGVTNALGKTAGFGSG